MTRKDFQLIADVLNQHLSYWKAANLPANLHVSEADLRMQSHGGTIAMLDLATTLSYELEKTNPRFNKALFLKACGIS